VLVVPSFIILAAYLWQLLPESFTLRARNWRWIVIGIALIASGLLSLACGPWVERRLFGGDLIRWLDGPRADSLYNSPWGGWLVLLLPVGGLTAALLAARFANPIMIIRFGSYGRRTF